MSRRRLLLVVLCLALSPTFAAAVDAPKPVWEPARATPPEDVKELRALQDTVKKVVDKTTPATVGVLLGMGAGSGVIVSPDGLVLTAAHVIEPGGANGSVVLYLSNGKRVRGKVLGRNPKTD